MCIYVSDCIETSESRWSEEVNRFRKILIELDGSDASMIWDVGVKLTIEEDGGLEEKRSTGKSVTKTNSFNWKDLWDLKDLQNLNNKYLPQQHKSNQKRPQASCERVERGSVPVFRESLSSEIFVKSGEISYISVQKVVDMAIERWKKAIDWIIRDGNVPKLSLSTGMMW